MRKVFNNMNIFENEKDKKELEMLLAMDAQMMENVAMAEAELEKMLDQFSVEELVTLILCWGNDMVGTSINLLMQADLVRVEDRPHFIQLIGKLMLTVKEGFEGAFYIAMKERLMKDDKVLMILLDIAKNGNLCPMAGPVEGGFDWRS